MNRHVRVIGDHRGTQLDGVKDLLGHEIGPDLLKLPWGGARVIVGLPRSIIKRGHSFPRAPRESGSACTVLLARLGI